MTDHTMEQSRRESTAHKADRVYRKVFAAVGHSHVAPYVWKAAFHQAAVEDGVKPKSELMVTIERICNERAVLEGYYDN